jgi:hypothetical protein
MPKIDIFYLQFFIHVLFYLIVSQFFEEAVTFCLFVNLYCKSVNLASEGETSCLYMSSSAKNAGMYLNFCVFAVVMKIPPPVLHAEGIKPRSCYPYSHLPRPVRATDQGAA